MDLSNRKLSKLWLVCELAKRLLANRRKHPLAALRSNIDFIRAIRAVLRYLDRS